MAHCHNFHESKIHHAQINFKWKFIFIRTFVINELRVRNDCKDFYFSYCIFFFVFVLWMVSACPWIPTKSWFAENVFVLFISSNVSFNIEIEKQRKNEWRRKRWRRKKWRIDRIHKPNLYKREYSINLEMELVICVPSCHVTYRIHMHKAVSNLKKRCKEKVKKHTHTNTTQINVNITIKFNEIKC